MLTAWAATAHAIAVTKKAVRRAMTPRSPGVPPKPKKKVTIDDRSRQLSRDLQTVMEGATSANCSKRSDELKPQMRRRAETDATTIEELRDALEKARARNDEDDDEPRAVAASGETTADDAERARESARLRCEKAEKALDAFRLEGMALAEEAERASRRNELLERFLRGAREDVGRARETLARRARVRADV